MSLIERIVQIFKGGEESPAPPNKPGRNEFCWCGSGKKYKKCHLQEDQKSTAKSCALNCGPT